VTPSSAGLPLVAASPAALARHVAGLLGLPVLASRGDEAAVAHQRLLLVATAATARSIVDDGHVRSLGSRLAAVVCWHVGALDLERLLGHLLVVGIPAFVGVPDRDELIACVDRADRQPLPSAADDLALAAYLAGIAQVAS
jgi:hypothetical protein